MSITRKQLYDQVWAKPMRDVAASYEVSGSFLTRVCRRLNIPCPPSGYWARIAAGQAPTKVPLPTPEPWDEIVWSRTDEPWPIMPLPQAPDPSTIGRVRRRGKRPPVHPLIVGARRQFEDLRNSHNEYLRPRTRRLPDIYVSKNTIDAALAVADALYLALEDCGHRVMFAPGNRPYSRPEVDERLQGGKGRERYQLDYRVWVPSSPTVVFIGSVAIGLTVFEISENVRMRWAKDGYVRADKAPKSTPCELSRLHNEVLNRDVPSGRLCLRASSTYWRAKWEKLWPESKPGQLLRKIGSIVRDLETGAPEIVPLVAEAERQAGLEQQRWEGERIERERRELERRRAENVRASREQLVTVIEAWGSAIRVKTFFDDARQRIETLEEPDRTMHLGRLTRARELLGSTDPLAHLVEWRTPEERPETASTLWPIGRRDP